MSFEKDNDEVFLAKWVADGEVGDFTHTGTLVIDADHPVKYLKLKNCTIQTLILKNVSFDYLYIQAGSNINQLKFESNGNIQKIDISFSHVKYVHFDKNTICPDFKITRSNIDSFRCLTNCPTHLAIDHSEIKELGYFRCNSAEATITLFACRGSVIMGLCLLKAIHLVADTKLEELSLHKCDLNALTILNDSLCKKITIENGKYSFISFEDYDKFGESIIHINNIKEVGTLALDNFHNKGQFEFHNTKITEALTLKKVILKDATFGNINIGNNRVHIENSSISEAKFLNINWRSDYTVEEKTDHSPYSVEFVKHLWTLLDTYRQLKKSYLNQNNNIEATHFKNHELRIYHQIIKTKSKIYYKNGKFSRWIKSLPDRSILWTSKTASNFGESIVRPLVGLFLFHLIWYLFLIYYFDLGIELSFPSDERSSWSAFLTGLDIYFYTLNPAHSSEIAGISILGWVDFLMRVSSGYFIFYFLKGTRKFHLV